MTWDLKELKNKVINKYDNEQYNLLDPCLTSIDKRQRFARYHFSEIKKLLNIDAVDFLKDKWIYRLHVEAHIFAIVQCMHGITDTLAHVIYYALALNKSLENSKIEFNKLNIIKVKERLMLNYKYKDLVELITQLICNDNYKFINAYVNHSKHSYLIGSSLLIGDSKKVNLDQFVSSKFVHKSTSYDERSILEFLESEYYRQAMLIVAIGIEINNVEG